MQALQQKLQSIIQANRLDAFYPPGSPVLQNVLNRLGRVDFKALGQKWNMPQELAYDLASLALYDVVIYADDSGSMVFEQVFLSNNTNKQKQWPTAPTPH
jgi:hypothetical protein